jgi:hypothetical protein
MCAPAADEESEKAHARAYRLAPGRRPPMFSHIGYMAAARTNALDRAGFEVAPPCPTFRTSRTSRGDEPYRRPLGSCGRDLYSLGRLTKGDVLAEKQAAKRRRRDNREQREREKATRSGDSPAQKAEQARRHNEASADRDRLNRSTGGETS